MKASPPQRPVYLIRMNFCTAWLSRIASRDERLVMGKPKRLSSQSSSSILGTEGVGSPSSLPMMKTQNQVPACWPFSGTQMFAAGDTPASLGQSSNLQNLALTLNYGSRASVFLPPIFRTWWFPYPVDWSPSNANSLSFCSNKKDVPAYSPGQSIVLFNPCCKRF